METQSVLKFNYEKGYDILSYLNVNIKFDDDIYTNLQVTFNLRIWENF